MPSQFQFFKKQIHFPLTKYLITLLVTAIISGCINNVKTEADPEQLTQVTQFLDAGDYNAAAEQYLSIAETFLDEDVPRSDQVPTHQPRESYQLYAAETYLSGHDTDKASNVLAQLDRSALLTPLKIRYDLTSARIAELDQQPALVIKALENIPDRLTPGQIADPETDPSQLQAQDDLQRDILNLRITAFDELASSDQVILSRMQLDELLEGEEQENNRRLIWQSLNMLDEKGLSQLQGEEPVTTLNGWIDLTIIAKHHLHDASTFDGKISDWRLSYPSHAAETPVLIELLEQGAVLGKKISSIALLLPSTGRFAQAAAAVRDGVMSAWYEDNNNPEQPRVQVYNTNEKDIIQVYESVIEDGADLVIGPLEKKSLLALLALPELPVTTLALNQLNSEELTDHHTHIDANRLYQFGLSPEHEAEQVAERAWAEGYNNGLAITPETPWGKRLFDAFVMRFETLGGTILEHQTFVSGSNDYSSPVTRLLNIDGSQQRYKSLTKQLNRKIKFEPRARRDMDFIFLAASPVQARQVRPQLLFHRASGTPVLATSHAYGLPERDEPDLDMEGIVIGDMPWLFNENRSDPDTPLSMQNNWPDDNAAFLRLFVLGMDAYEIAPHLGRLRLLEKDEFSGASGELSMNKQGQILRQLSWAKFIQGKPEMLEQLSIREPKSVPLPDNESDI